MYVDKNKRLILGSHPYIDFLLQLTYRYHCKNTLVGVKLDNLYNFI